MRELYPDVNCKIFYQRDYLDLLIKYGLERPSQDMVPRPTDPSRAADFGGLMASQPKGQSK